VGGLWAENRQSTEWVRSPQTGKNDTWKDSVNRPNAKAFGNYAAGPPGRNRVAGGAAL
jgi:hypothetical protein